MVNLFRRSITHLLVNAYLLLIMLGGVVVALHSVKKITPALIAGSLFIAMTALLFSITRRLKMALTATALLFLLLAFFNQLKVHYYKEQLMSQDLYLLIDPANLSTLVHYYGTGAGIVALLIVSIITLYATNRVEWRGASLKHRLIAFIVGIGSCALFIKLATDPRNQANWEMHLPKGQGVVANLSLSLLAEKNYQAPQFATDSAYFQQKLPTVVQHHADLKPDIIALLQESTVNPLIYNVGVSTPPIPELAMFKLTPAVKAHGPLRVHTFGGGTWISEFSFLTGLVSDDFGTKKSAVYYSVVPHLQYSLFKELKNQGYHTVVLTPFNKSAYHSGVAWQAMGVDEILQPQDLGHPADKNVNLWNISSAEVYKYIQEILRTKTDKPLFIFALTMNEHGPYEPSYRQTYHFSQVQDQGKSAQMNHFISKISELSQATVDFNTFIQRREKPTLFASFGDHQPGIRWQNGYHLKLDKPEYMTQFTLVDNLQGDVITPQILDISLLGGLLLERAGLATSPFYRANIAMRHLCQGALEDCADKQLLESYKSYLYRDLNAAGK